MSEVVWEYYVVELSDRNQEMVAELDELGSLGWELVFVLPGSNEPYKQRMVFKRRVEP